MTKNIRELLGWNGSYADINREERNLTAILYHALLVEDNLSRFLKLINCKFEVKDEECGIYFEYAYVRDLWSNIGEGEDKNEKKRNVICEYLGPIDNEKIKEIKEPGCFNNFFGAVPLSGKYIQSPSRWTLKNIDDNIKDRNNFWNICMFKWSFNAKPDIVIHTSKNEAICIEAKLESSESKYPQSLEEKNIFKRRNLPLVRQTELQKYLMEELLGIKTEFVLIQNSGDKDVSLKVKEFKGLCWEDIFNELNITKIPNFMNKTIDGAKKLRNKNRNHKTI